jgi:hypothetical protein
MVCSLTGTARSPSPRRRLCPLEVHVRTSPGVGRNGWFVIGVATRRGDAQLWTRNLDGKGRQESLFDSGDCFSFQRLDLTIKFLLAKCRDLIANREGILLEAADAARERNNGRAPCSAAIRRSDGHAKNRCPTRVLDHDAGPQFFGAGMLFARQRQARADLPLIPLLAIDRLQVVRHALGHLGIIRRRDDDL